MAQARIRFHHLLPGPGGDFGQDPDAGHRANDGWVTANREFIAMNVADAVKGVAEWLGKIEWKEAINGVGELAGISEPSLTTSTA